MMKHLNFKCQNKYMKKFCLFNILRAELLFDMHFFLSFSIRPYLRVNYCGKMWYPCMWTSGSKRLVRPWLVCCVHTLHPSTPHINVLSCSFLVISRHANGPFGVCDWCAKPSLQCDRKAHAQKLTLLWYRKRTKPLKNSSLLGKCHVCNPPLTPQSIILLTLIWTSLHLGYIKSLCTIHYVACKLHT